MGVLRGKAGSPPNPGEGSRAQLAAPWRGLGRHRGPRFRKRRRLRPPTYRLGRPARPRAALPFSGPSSLQTQRDTCRGLAPPDDFLKKSGLEILNLSPLPPPKICQDLMRLVGVLESDPLPASTRIDLYQHICCIFAWGRYQLMARDVVYGGHLLKISLPEVFLQPLTL